MGSSSYSADNRAFRSASLGYHTKNVNDVFEQNKVRKIHDSMDPKKALLREARDSDVHPNTVPIIVGLDVTGSMGKIPHELVKDGLPHMMSSIIEAGIPDPALLFLAIGDHKTDNYPLQVGQFESGDAELDMWLTRTYLEGGGGGNGGESYALAWYFAGNHTVTDAWEKRQSKGFLFTIGDEPIHPHYSASAIKEVMGIQESSNYTDEDLLALAQQKYNVYHLHIADRPLDSRWKDLLKENIISLNDYTEVAKVIAQIIIDNTPKTSTPISSSKEEKQENTPSIYKTI